MTRATGHVQTTHTPGRPAASTAARKEAKRDPSSAQNARLCRDDNENRSDGRGRKRGGSEGESRFFAALPSYVRAGRMTTRTEARPETLHGGHLYGNEGADVMQQAGAVAFGDDQLDRDVGEGPGGGAGVLGEEDDRNFGHDLFELARGLQAVEDRHGNVEDDE